ncbi:hypothetical protein [Rhodoligotrophos appendicifer]|uniref:hypothetical protein n=1 Tax=Rhodoligotrophos appendicifer TaxID=987056 RepID=UPI0011859FFD|nr:hypothetical protein [Rhodoligotrophos appendicifer]
MAAVFQVRSHWIEDKIMKEKKILVRPVEDSWTIDIDGQNYDLFSTEQEAMERAARWPQNAVKQGY